jgi:hypothetical protein
MVDDQRAAAGGPVSTGDGGQEEQGDPLTSQPTVHQVYIFLLTASINTSYAKSFVLCTVCNFGFICSSVEDETDEKTASLNKKIDLRYNGPFCCAGVGIFCTHGITTFCSGKLVACSILAGSS